VLVVRTSASHVRLPHAPFLRVQTDNTRSCTSACRRAPSSRRSSFTLLQIAISCCFLLCVDRLNVSLRAALSARCSAALGNAQFSDRFKTIGACDLLRPPHRPIVANFRTMHTPLDIVSHCCATASPLRDRKSAEFGCRTPFFFLSLAFFNGLRLVFRSAGVAPPTAPVVVEKAATSVR
jgi:hypothetical protein